MDGERRLREIVRSLDRAAVAFSGGVDSAVLLRVCAEELGDRAVGVVAVSASLPREELEAARALAREMGVELVEARTDEIADPAYARNAPDRCFHCKTSLFAAMEEIAARRGLRALVYGANASDATDHRPGARAAAEHEVRAPLQEAGLVKEEVRALARRLGLGVWDKPAAPCLASRIPYGTPVTPEALGRIEEAERFLRGLGFAVVRVRHHDDLARLEVSPDDLPRALAERERIVSRLREIGYAYVTLDLTGFRSGSLNEVLSRRRGE